MRARILLCCVLAFLAVVTAPVAAVAATSPAPRVAAPSAIIIDRVTGRVLHAKDVHRERPMASCTKIMTALLVVERRRDLGKYVVALPAPGPTAASASSPATASLSGRRSSPSW